MPRLIILTAGKRYYIIIVRCSVKYVLFDSWFAYPITITKICSFGLHVLARVKDSTKTKYLVNGAKKTAKEIYKENRKRRGKSRYLLSVAITIPTEEDGKKF